MTDDTAPECLPPVLRVDEVAAWLRVSKDSIYRAAADGTLPALRLGRALRFSRAAVERWIDGEAAS